MTLLKRLQDTRAWLMETKGAKHVSPKLNQDELEQIIIALQLKDFGFKAHEVKRKPLSNCA